MQVKKNTHASTMLIEYARNDKVFLFFLFTLVTGPRRSLSLELSDTRVYGPQIRARLGTTAQGLVALSQF